MLSIIGHSESSKSLERQVPPMISFGIPFAVHQRAQFRGPPHGGGKNDHSCSQRIRCPPGLPVKSSTAEDMELDMAAACLHSPKRLISAAKMERPPPKILNIKTGQEIITHKKLRKRAAARLVL